MLYRVMIVDDEPISRQYIRSLIDWEKEGFLLCAEAQNAQEALSFIKLHEVQIVLLDVFMPGKNGVYLSSMIRRYYPDVAMLAISSFDDYDYVRDILKNGAQDYILKHRLNAETLKEALSSVRDNLDRGKKGRKPSESEAQRRMRGAVESFIAGTGDLASLEEAGFYRRGMQFVVSAFRAVNLEAVTTNYSDEEKRLLTAGIVDILESDRTLRNVALCDRNREFLVFHSFSDIVFEAKIQSAVSLFKMKMSNTLNMLFQLDVDSASTDILFGPQKFREAVKSLKNSLDGMRPSFEKSLQMGQRPKNPVVSLSIRLKKRIFQAIDDGNIPAMNQTLSEIYGGIDPADERGKLLITKELYDILKNSVSELDIRLDFLFKGNELFEWAQLKSIEEIRQRLTGLFKLVLMEVMQKKRAQDYSDYVRRTILYISDHFMEPVGLNSIAAWIGVSASYLSRIFRQEVGKTLVDYINWYRIEMSKQYMLLQDVNIKEISSRTGFKNYNYFFTVFKEQEGLTPIEYIKKSKCLSINTKF